MRTSSFIYASQLSAIVLVLTAGSVSSRSFPVELEFPTAASAPTFPLLCEWLQRMSQQLGGENETDLSVGRRAVLDGLMGVNDSTWEWLQADELVPAIIDNVTNTQCEYNESLSEYPWHSWKRCDDFIVNKSLNKFI